MTKPVCAVVGIGPKNGASFARKFAAEGYAIALLQGSIWYKRKWSSTLKSMFDGLIYSLLTAGVFGWLWPGV